MTFWIIAAVVVVLFGAFAWWSSGRAKPRGNQDHEWSSTEADHVARSQGGGGGGLIGGGGY